MLAAAQAVEHYEIARYGTLKSWALQLGHKDVAQLLDQTLSEETKTDQALTQLAETKVNREGKAKVALNMPGAGSSRCPLSHRTKSGSASTAMFGNWSHICVDMQRMFAEDTPWRVSWMEAVSAVVEVAERYSARTRFTASVRRSAQPATALSEDQQESLDELKKLSGAEFDDAYQDDQEDAHEDAVGVFKRYADEGDNADLKAWAAKTLPDLEHHLKMAEDLDNK